MYQIEAILKTAEVPLRASVVFLAGPISAGVLLKIRIHLNTNPEKKPVLDLGRRTREIPHGG